MVHKEKEVGKGRGGGGGGGGALSLGRDRESSFADVRTSGCLSESVTAMVFVPIPLANRVHISTAKVFITWANPVKIPFIA